MVTEDAIRCLIISHHLLNTNEIILIHHTRCGMLAFTDDLLKAGLEGDPAAEKLIGQATNRTFVTTGKASASPIAFHAFRFRGQPDTGRSAQRQEHGASRMGRPTRHVDHTEPSLATHHRARRGTVRGFIHDVDTGRLEEVGYPGPMGSFS